ncbi:MAG: flagellar hook-associated protein FlgL [bacterium]|nr:flagellar hook-associated protein FlgL [bacterium]
MRVTYNTIANNILRNLSNNLTRLEKLQSQLSSGKKVIKPSDDPVSASRIMGLRSTLNTNSQYDRNVNFLETELNVADKALQNLSSALSEIKSLALRGAGESLSQEDREAIASEVNQIIDHIVQIGNTDIGGRYIFGGYKTTSAPLERVDDNILYKGDANIRRIEVSNGVTIEASPTGKTLFVDTEMFDTLISLKNAFLDGNTAQINNSIEKVDAIINRLSSETSSLGARLKRVELTKDVLSDKSIRYTDLLSKQEDIEIEDVVLKLYAQQNVYQASLIAASRAIQPSLIDYLG